MKKNLQKRIIRVAKVLEKLSATKKVAEVPKAFLQAYVEALLWSTPDYSDGRDGNEMLDRNYSSNDFSKEAVDQIKKDCAAFLEAAEDMIDGEYSQAGHDFWLTRNGHGAGFWDGDWDEEVGEKLTELSKKFGEQDPYVGDDGLIYI